MKYTTNFKLMAPVNDVLAAQRYLAEDDMTEFLKDDRRSNGFEDKLVRIEWWLEDKCSGEIILYTKERLTEEQLAQVSDWVRGQNSDGLGEGFEQQPFANYRDEDYDEDEDYEAYYDDSWVMASFDWETNEYKFTSDEDETENAESEKEENEMTTKAKDYVERFNTKEEAIDAIHEEALEKISQWLERIDGENLLKILADEFGEEIHPMDEFDEFYEDMRPSEILEELYNIDTSDEYFNSDTCMSGNDLWDLTDHIQSEDIVNALYEEGFHISASPVQEILSEEAELIKEVTAQFEASYAVKANALFEKLYTKDPEELIKVLSNMVEQDA